MFEYHGAVSVDGSSTRLARPTGSMATPVPPCRDRVRPVYFTQAFSNSCASTPGRAVAEEVSNDEFNFNNNMNNHIIFPDAESAPKRPRLWYL